MLQQTRVDTVIDYYERFLKRFPSVESLAAAGDEQVLKLWEGLGYYRRVLNMHRAARMLRDAGRTMPRTAAELRELPGIGTYTAAAIASIANGERAAAVDGNVARVLARLFGVEQDVLSPVGKRIIQSIADQLMPPARCGDFNQAWMDLGSSVCTPQSPACGRCPLRACCVAAAKGLTDTLPLRARARSVPEVRLVTAIVRAGDAFLVRRRPTGGLWSGLWEFPAEPLADGEDTATALTRLLRAELDGSSRPRATRAPQSVGTVTHRLTHRLMHFEVRVIDLKSQPLVQGAAGGTRRWVTRRDFARLSVSQAHRRIAQVVIDAVDRE